MAALKRAPLSDCGFDEWFETQAPAGWRSPTSRQRLHDCWQAGRWYTWETGARREKWAFVPEEMPSPLDRRICQIAWEAGAQWQRNCPDAPHRRRSTARKRPRSRRRDRPDAPAASRSPSPRQSPKSGPGRGLVGQSSDGFDEWFDARAPEGWRSRDNRQQLHRFWSAGWMFEAERDGYRQRWQFYAPDESPIDRQVYRLAWEAGRDWFRRRHDRPPEPLPATVAAALTALRRRNDCDWADRASAIRALREGDETEAADWIERHPDDFARAIDDDLETVTDG